MQNDENTLRVRKSKRIQWANFTKFEDKKWTEFGSLFQQQRTDNTISFQWKIKLNDAMFNREYNYNIFVLMMNGAMPFWSKIKLFANSKYTDVSN